MKERYLNNGIILALIGICFVLAAVFTESAFDGLLWGFAGGALGPGIGAVSGNTGAEGYRSSR